MENEGERVVIYGGRAFHRFCCTVHNTERTVWAVSYRQAERMVARYTGANEEHIETRRAPLYLDLDPLPQSERSAA